jgi:endonuclease YncB( thermonuclease family)
MVLTVPHLYLAVVTRIVDGDTIEVDEDHGKDVVLARQIYRLHGGNAWDQGQPGRESAKANLQNIVGLAVRIRSYKPGKDVEPDKWGGRWLARVETNAGDLTDLLIASGWMVAWDGRGKAPTPVWPRPAGLPDFAALIAAGEAAS